MKTLILNSGYEPMQIVSWQRALCLVLSEKAEIIAQYSDRIVRTVSQQFPLPSVVRLRQYVRTFCRFGIIKCTRKNVLLRDRYECQYCGIRCSVHTITIDHITPRSKNGKMEWDNVVACCDDCNRKKGDKSPGQAGMRLLRLPKKPTWWELVGDRNFNIESTWFNYLKFWGS